MNLNKRQEQIMQMLNTSGKIKVSELSKKLFFSEMTIRRDLKKMEKEGLLKRVHGGAIENISDYQYPIDYRIKINKSQKQHLATEASKHLANNQVIFFNSSSTLAYIVPYLLKYRDLQVITNSVYLLQYIVTMHIPCYLTGGKYNEIERCLSGRHTEEFLKEVNPDIAFISCDALSDDGYVSDSNSDIAEISRIIVNRSKKAILLMDRSKIGTVCTYSICHTDKFNDVILF